MRSRKRTFLGSLFFLMAALGLTACGPQNGTQSPDDQVLKKGIAQLIQTFEGKYPQLKNWDDSAVKEQLVGKLPVGVSSEAGWHLIWPHATEKQLSQVYVPWSLIGQMPETFPADGANYSGGKNVPGSVTQDIRRQFQLMTKVGDYFSAITHVRYSTANSKYIIFESIPYLPVTDPAYGWASATTGAWKVIDYGTAMVGCGTVPSNVQSEFGFTCP